MSSFRYQFKLEFGLNYDNFSSIDTQKELEETKLFIETNRATVLISLFVKAKKEETKFVTIEIFALQDEEPETSNLIAYASKIPVYNDQAQFTKHWKDNKNFFDEKMKNDKTVIYLVIKELDENYNVLTTNYLHKDLVENNNEKN